MSFGTSNTVLLPSMSAASQSIDTLIKKQRDYLSSLRISPPYTLAELSTSSIVRCDSDQKLPALTTPSLLQNCTLHAFQRDCVRWLGDNYRRGMSCILADEMGLGKTVQSIAFILHIYEVLSTTSPNQPPFLIVCPLSVLQNWKQELTRFAPSLKVVSFAGSEPERQALRSQIRSANVVITTFEYVLLEEAFLAASNFQALIVDEAHRLKNSTSRLSLSLQHVYQFRFRLLLTGTPCQNNLEELWSLVNFVSHSFPSKEEFLSLFGSMQGQSQVASSSSALTSTSTSLPVSSSSLQVSMSIDDPLPTALRALIHPYILRRTKKEVSLALPPKRQVVVYTPLTSLQQTLYRAVLTRNASSVLQAVQVVQAASKLTSSLSISNSSNNYDDISNSNTFSTPLPSSSSSNMHSQTQCLSSVLASLKKICNHPYLIPGVEPEPFSEGPHIWQRCGKLRFLHNLLPKLRKAGHRVLIFSTSTAALDVLQDYLGMEDIPHERLDGGVRGVDRFAAVDRFQGNGNGVGSTSVSAEPFVFLLSTRAGGQGLTLTNADTVIFYDSDYNPMVDEQAENRAHRIGQTKPVLILRLLAEKTMEEVFYRRGRRKVSLTQLVLADAKRARLVRKITQLKASIKTSSMVSTSMKRPMISNTKETQSIVKVKGEGKMKGETKTPVATAADLMREAVLFGMDALWEAPSQDSWSDVQMNELIQRGFQSTTTSEDAATLGTNSRASYSNESDDELESDDDDDIGEKVENVENDEEKQAGMGNSMDVSVGVGGGCGPKRVKLDDSKPYVFTTNNNDSDDIMIDLTRDCEDAGEGKSENLHFSPVSSSAPGSTTVTSSTSTPASFLSTVGDVSGNTGSNSIYSFNGVDYTSQARGKGKSSGTIGSKPYLSTPTPTPTQVQAGVPVSTMSCLRRLEELAQQQGKLISITSSSTPVSVTSDSGCDDLLLDMSRLQLSIFPNRSDIGMGTNTSSDFASSAFLFGTGSVAELPDSLRSGRVRTSMVDIDDDNSDGIDTNNKTGTTNVSKPSMQDIAFWVLREKNRLQRTLRDLQSELQTLTRSHARFKDRCTTWEKKNYKSHSLRFLLDREELDRDISFMRYHVKNAAKNNAVSTSGMFGKEVIAAAVKDAVEKAEKHLDEILQLAEMPSISAIADLNTSTNTNMNTNTTSGATMNTSPPLLPTANEVLTAFSADSRITQFRDLLRTTLCEIGEKRVVSAFERVELSQQVFAWKKEWFENSLGFISAPTSTSISISTNATSDISRVFGSSVPAAFKPLGSYLDQYEDDTINNENSDESPNQDSTSGLTSVHPSDECDTLDSLEDSSSQVFGRVFHVVGSVTDPLSTLGANAWSLHESDAVADNPTLHRTKVEVFSQANISASMAFQQCSGYILINSLDNGGSYGSGALLSAISQAYGTVPAMYENASNYHDLSLGDVQMIEVKPLHPITNTSPNGSVIPSHSPYFARQKRGKMSMADRALLFSTSTSPNTSPSASTIGTPSWSPIEPLVSDYDWASFLHTSPRGCEVYVANVIIQSSNKPGVVISKHFENAVAQIINFAQAHNLAIVTPQIGVMRASRPPRGSSRQQQQQHHQQLQHQQQQQKALWYQCERMLSQGAVTHNVPVFVFYYPRAGVPKWQDGFSKVPRASQD